MLIINNVNFDNKKKHRTRDGSEEDKVRLRNTFRFLGFSVEVEEDKSSTVR